MIIYLQINEEDAAILQVGLKRAIQTATEDATEYAKVGHPNLTRQFEKMAAAYTALLAKLSHQIPDRP